MEHVAAAAKISLLVLV
uniref:Uncharacterized protein n=1 Tax=Anguilla anguilla TaxID=7936 RepID=A0A0E9T9N4_ANGAN